MSKKKIFLAVGALILVILGASLSFFHLRQTKTLVKPLPETNQVSAPAEIKTGELLLYEDEAGFSFQYPATLGIVEKDVNDPSVYSSLELSSKEKPGEKLVLKITDTTFSNIDKWLKDYPQGGKLITTSEVSLSGMKGRLLKYDSPSRNLILVLDSGILYFLESPAEKGFWEQAFSIVSQSFQLTGEKTTSSVIDEGEEIIE
ncbi:MAG: hypothetical protein ACOZBZ_01355 [Patescibacteria group bacterium]